MDCPFDFLKHWQRDCGTLLMCSRKGRRSAAAALPQLLPERASSSFRTCNVLIARPGSGQVLFSHFDFRATLREGPAELWNETCKFLWPSFCSIPLSLKFLSRPTYCTDVLRATSCVSPLEHLRELGLLSVCNKTTKSAQSVRLSARYVAGRSKRQLMLFAWDRLGMACVILRWGRKLEDEKTNQRAGLSHAFLQRHGLVSRAKGLLHVPRPSVSVVTEATVSNNRSIGSEQQRDCRVA